MPRVVSDWISLSEAARIFAEANVPISRSTLARWAHSGKLQSIQPGRQIYVRRAQVRAMLRPGKRGLSASQLQPGFFEDLDGVSDGGGSPPRSDDRAATGPSRARSAGATRGAAARACCVTRWCCRITDVMRAYDRGGGGMLAGALAYFAFFTMVPALLLFVSLLGVLVEDRDLRDQLVASLVDRLDPISEVATVVIDGLAGSGRTGTVIGVLGLLWGASGFYGALQGAMAAHVPRARASRLPADADPGPAHGRAHPGRMLAAVRGHLRPAPPAAVAGGPLPRPRRPRPAGPASRPAPIDVGSIGAVGAIAATMVVATLAALDRLRGHPAGRCLAAAGAAASPPRGHRHRAVHVRCSAGWRRSSSRQWLTLGIVGSVFISLIWFNLVFQALVYGAAFARLRRDDERSRALRLAR